MEISGLPLTILKILFFGTLLGLLFAILKNGIKFLAAEKTYSKRLNDVFLNGKTIAWLIFGFWSIELIALKDPWYTRIFAMVLIITIIGISWTIVRDLITGLLTKMDGSYMVNGWIRVKDIEGKIKSFGFRSLEIETEKGETVNIAYHLLNQEMIVRSQPTESVMSCSFEIEVPKTKPFNEYQKIIRIEVLNSHWVSLKREPKIKLLGEENGSLLLQVTAYTLDERYFDDIETLIKSLFIPKQEASE
ncbi:MAG: hypothetical protein COB85_02010 [Bacteroidetes bacterium]|nr:MAG: hypothetical protein COB85_02010 [Bacteroidota bacterium]